MNAWCNWKNLSLFGLLGWAYLPTLQQLIHLWFHEPQYSHGILVPFFAAYLFWQRRSQASMGKPASPIGWLGYPLLFLGLAGHLLGGLTDFVSLDALSLLFCLAGIVFLIGGKPLWQQAWPALCFLVFMIPLPYRVEIMMGQDLQRIATWGSTFALQTLGQPAVAEGNIILIRDVKLGVAEACSGLRMLMTFAAFSVAAVFLVQRSWLEKLLILLSSVPIAMLTNILRIVSTGLAYIYLGNESHAVHFLHDLYGWLMMPIGLGLLMLELWMFKHLLLLPEAESP